MMLLLSCTLNPNVADAGDAYLQGDWEEDSIAYKDQLASYEKYKFRFTCDSFYLEILNFSKVNFDTGDCYSGNTWKEYAKGVYTVNLDTLLLNGAYVSENYRYKPQGSCYRFGNLKEKFLLEKLGEDTVILKNNITPFPHILVIKNRFSCDLIKEQ